MTTSRRKHDNNTNNNNNDDASKQKSAELVSANEISIWGQSLLSLPQLEESPRHFAMRQFDWRFRL